MTDKEHIAKWLKGKLAELCNEIQCEVSELPKDVIEGKILAFKEILSYMKSLQEEPKPLFNVGDTIRNKQWKTATHKIVSMDDKAYYLENEGKVEITHQELWEVVGEPVSEELEKTIDAFLATYFGNEKEKQEWPFLKKMAIHFANWQREQMIKNSIEVKVKADKDGFYTTETWDEMNELLQKIGAKAGDKVYICIIKQEEE